VIGLELVAMFDRQPGENIAEGGIYSYGVFFAAVSKKPFHVIISKFGKKWPTPIPVHNSKLEIALHSLFYCATPILALRFCRHAYLLPPMAKSGVPNNVSVGSESSPRHASIQE